MALDPQLPKVTAEHVLVPLDGSELAAQAIPTARALAERLGADVQAIAVAGDTDGAGRVRADAASALGVDAADDRIAVAMGADPADAIVQRARALEPALVCLSTHGRGRVAGALVGSVATGVLQRSSDPIVAVGPHARRASGAAAPAPTGRLVACVDGTAASETVLPVAAAWARTFGMALAILTVAEPDRSR